MTRFLADSLGVDSYAFRLALRQLEEAHGNPSADIYLSTDVLHATQNKLKALGLDPLDTTGKELYQTLLERIKANDAVLVKNLRTRAARYVSAEGEIVAGMVHALQEAPVSHTVMAMKSTSFKAIIKKAPPKRALKVLGYRSVDSFLKHESPATILAAARLTESASWQKQLVEQYKKLKANDFETRPVAIIHPDSKHWRELSAKSLERTKHNVLSFPELGAVVLLPLPNQVPAGVATASLALSLHALNELRAASTFLKLSVVRPDFGAVVQTIATSEPQLDAQVLDKSVPWQVVQRYYARMQHLFRDELFEPHIRLDDLAWPSVEKLLSHIEPSLTFWQQSTALATIHDHQPVSLNIVDAALNLCNMLPFEKRIVHHFQNSLWHELLLKYLKHDTVEQSILAQLQPQLAAEPVMA